MIKALDGNPGHIDILAAGTAMRFLTAYLSVTPGTRIITGTERMQQRPIRILVDALRELGAQIEYAGKEGFPPLRITGTELTGEEISLAGNVSSQYICFTDDRPHPEKRIEVESYRRNHFPPLH